MKILLLSRYFFFFLFLKDSKNSTSPLAPTLDHYPDLTHRAERPPCPGHEERRPNSVKKPGPRPQRREPFHWAKTKPFPRGPAGELSPILRPTRTSTPPQTYQLPRPSGSTTHSNPSHSTVPYPRRTAGTTHRAIAA